MANALYNKAREEYLDGLLDWGADVGAAGIASGEALGQPIVGDIPAQEITGAGGITSEEAIGQPAVSAVSGEQASTGGRVYPIKVWFLPAQEIRARGIESEEAIGAPVIALVPTGRPRKLRETEWLLRRAA